MVYKIEPLDLVVLFGKRGRFGGNAWTIASGCLLARLLAWWN